MQPVEEHSCLPDPTTLTLSRGSTGGHALTHHHQYARRWDRDTYTNRAGWLSWLSWLPGRICTRTCCDMAQYRSTAILQYYFSYNTPTWLIIETSLMTSELPSRMIDIHDHHQCTSTPVIHPCPFVRLPRQFLVPINPLWIQVATYKVPESLGASHPDDPRVA